MIDYQKTGPVSLTFDLSQ